MRKDRKYMLAGGFAILLGWFGVGYSFTTKLGHPISTISFLGGIILSIVGIVLFIIGANTKSYKK